MLTKRTHILTTLLVLELFVFSIFIRLLFQLGPQAAFVWLLLVFVFARVTRRHRIRKQERLNAHDRSAD